MAASDDGGGAHKGYYTALYLCVTALLTMLVALLFYVLCSRRYRLNWFERQQLVQSAEEGRVTLSQMSLVAPSDATETRSGKIPRSQSVGRLDSWPSQDSGQFWVPPSLKRQASVCQSDGPNDLSGEDSQPGTPSAPFIPTAGSPGEKSAGQQVVKYVQPPTNNGPRPKLTSMYSKLDHTKIDTSMYDKNEKAAPSSPTDATRGSVQFGISYQGEMSLLSVHVFQVHQLPAREFSGAADPYIKVRLLPERVSRQSSVHRKTLNPTFDEEFVFDVTEAQLEEKSVELLVFDYDQNSTHECMGHVLMPLEALKLQKEERRVLFWKALEHCEDISDQPDIGHLMFSLSYLPSATRLTVVILKAKDLKPMDEAKKTTDPYVKVSMILDGKRLKKKKTSTLRGNLFPVFNEALTFSVTKDQLKTIALEFTVVHENLLGQNETLGTVLLSPESKGLEAEHLQAMIVSNKAVAMWHALVPPATS